MEQRGGNLGWARGCPLQSIPENQASAFLGVVLETGTVPLASTKGGICSVHTDCLYFHMVYHNFSPIQSHCSGVREGVRLSVQTLTL